MRDPRKQQMKRLSKWQIIGLCFTIMWIIGSIYVQYNNSVNTATTFSDASYKTCVQALEKKQIKDVSSCALQKQSDYETFVKNMWQNAIAVAIIPLPFYWMYGFIALTISRCFVHGSRQVIRIDELSKSKKVFAYFCYLYLGLSVFIVIVAAMHLYVDTKVPAQFGFRSSVNIYDDYVVAEGTWTRNSLIEDNGKMLFPLHTSKIICRRDKKSCIESKAIISTTGNGPYLMTDVNEYDVTSWTKDAIVYANYGACFTEIYTIDLNSKIVNSTEKFSANVPNPKYCEAPGSGHVDAKYKLDDGYTVYNKLTRDASPYLLRVIYSLFGN